MSLEMVKKKFQSYSPDGNWAIIEKAYSFALKVHAGQKRVSGEVYIIHPLGVAQIIADLELDPVTIAAGILHDVVEDTETSLEELREIFGEEISLLVDGVTKLSKLQFTSKEEHQAENLRKMFVAMAKDIRVILIKLADRLHNMRTLKYLYPAKRKEIATETLEIYAPLAHRLGIYKVKWELEDLAFRFLEPEKYYNLVDRLVKKREDREEFISRVIIRLKERLEDVGIEADIQGRPKHLYGIYEKMERQDKDINEIYDLTGIRLVVENIKDCYGALGIVHTLWRPIPGRFKDFIAMPKANMYQSLHTTVVCAKNELLEVQIRTWEMHRTSEYGIAAHWRYKEGVKGDEEFEEKLSWLRQLLEWQQDLKDAHEFMENLKIDLFTDEVFVFTPKGDVINLPAGAIPLDFAYRIHTDIGHRCVGAKVNGRLVPLEYRLSTGDIMEIITSKQGTPSRDWLKMVKSSQAKSKIRSWFKKEKKEENIIRGKEILEKELRRIYLDPRELLKPAILVEIGKRFNLLSEEDVYSAVGYGGVTHQQIITRLREEHKKMHKDEVPLEEPKLKPWKDKAKAGKGVRIEGMDNLLIRFARCCNPLPGDQIVGFITRGRGVSIHRKDCPNILSREDSLERGLNASWEQDSKVSYPVEVQITALDRTNLLQELVAAVSESKINITAVHGRTNKNQVATIHLTIVVRDLEHLQHTMNRLRKVKDVFTVGRTTSN
ncbi:RelA/SpoT family protein [Candidatus Contubernalis alkaliaceticus]|uniref:RelA/SpoT family protein n=1 Tax=Candidatus Contubernalis alkaliaceticus TaxID=338645 RepID=UPI001F4C1E8E|nr:bifunctional (p)ppGpp synthetase/guanosine-3',5'-bis(diphosphate) 3'-pyrophosphohydrolase [Candidatus Contubernalis alkalaceticus]UNC92891.1 bifunctional (p)ppGpp synthetase/guanosine-3',5'-bis(diphosphate) 3'-pyrophosphohydrolase [Candidatus Contubernalis alkalaceticus]